MYQVFDIGPCLSAILFLIASCHATALVISPVWDTSITNDPNVATIQATINAAIQFYEARFADPITVTIKFKGITSGLGQATTYSYTIPYTTFLTYLQNDATSTNDVYALGHLPPGPNNPITGDSSVTILTANLRAIGINGLDSLLPGGVDGIVSLNTSQMNLSRTTINPAKYDLLSVAEHEINEVLALGSNLPKTNHPCPMDLFRYASNGIRNFSTNGDNAYFSLDGTNLLVRFNQQSSGDYGDWWSTGVHTPRVQDAFATAAATPDLDLELLALDVSGYDLLPLPQPGIASFTVSRSNLIVTATNGVATRTYVLLSNTNLTLPIDQWLPVGTNVLGDSGNFTFTATNAVNPSAQAQFYILQTH